MKWIKKRKLFLRVFSGVFDEQQNVRGRKDCPTVKHYKKNINHSPHRTHDSFSTFK
jgi:hypothetical protein